MRRNEYRVVTNIFASGAVGAEIGLFRPRRRRDLEAHLAHSPVDGAGRRRACLFAEYVLGCSRGHQLRHAKVYRNFRAEYDRLQRERVASFKEFRADAGSGAYPVEKHLVPIAEAEFAVFMTGPRRAAAECSGLVAEQ